MDYTWNAAIPRGVNTKPVELTYSVVNDKLLMVNVNTNNFKDLLGLQYTLHFDNDKYEFVRIDNSKLGIVFNAAQANSTGSISMLWTDVNALPKTLEDGTGLFTLVLRKKGLGIRNWDAINNLQLTINNSITEVEAWDNDEVKHNVIITKKQIANYNNDKPETINALTIYPNPAKGAVTIQSNEGIKQVRLMDITGKEISRQKPQQDRSVLQINFNLHHYSKGMYLLNVLTEKGNYIEKLVVE